MTALLPDPIRDRVLKDYEYWKDKADRGEIGMFSIDIRPYLPVRKQVTSYGRREQVDKGISSA